MEIVDLSLPVENNLSEPWKMKISRIEHKRGAFEFCRNVAWNKNLPFRKRIDHFFSFLRGKKKLTPKNFPDGLFLSADTVTLPTHMGTHIDAPFHYGPFCEGKPSKKTEELPLHWFFQDGIRFDMTKKKPGSSITAADIKKQLDLNFHELKENTIVLFWTGTDKLYGKREYFFKAPGLALDAVEFLLEKGVKVIGIDTFGLDRPFKYMLEDFWATRNEDLLWPCHFIGRKKEFIHLERLANLETLPFKGFKICCFPLRIKGMDASWVRAVAIKNKEN